MNSLYPDCRLLVMAKSPHLGRVKTRMQPQFSQQFSRHLHVCLLDYCLSQWRAAAVCPISLWLAGEKATLFDALPHHATMDCRQQVGQDLGERMLYAARDGLSAGQNIVLVGTDCPFIDKRYLLAACKALSTNEAVIGPAADGGYVLLGLRRAYPSLFHNMEWGTQRVFGETLEALKKSQCRYHVLSTLNDIDRPEDIALLKKIPFFDKLQQG
ncbi:MAG: TIGR04282 family arsenosugar biosynthesis glycosyltransferase [Pseudomonadota bacterium]